MDNKIDKVQEDQVNNIIQSLIDNDAEWMRGNIIARLKYYACLTNRHTKLIELNRNFEEFLEESYIQTEDPHDPFFDYDEYSDILEERFPGAAKIQRAFMEECAPEEIVENEFNPPKGLWFSCAEEYFTYEDIEKYIKLIDHFIDGSDPENNFISVFYELEDLIHDADSLYIFFWSYPR